MWENINKKINYTIVEEIAASSLFGVTSGNGHVYTSSCREVESGVQ